MLNLTEKWDFKGYLSSHTAKLFIKLQSRHAGAKVQIEQNIFVDMVLQTCCGLSLTQAHFNGTPEWKFMRMSIIQFLTQVTKAYKNELKPQLCLM